MHFRVALYAAVLMRVTAEGEARLRQQQELYEAVRSERNSYSRNLVEVQVGCGAWVVVCDWLGTAVVGSVAVE